ncbi:MAG: hypothetical protein MUC60_00300 [Oscillatoria sp. Prado101]|nr:hypothetical protein [Oscillatoria sp. Prado101]
MPAGKIGIELLRGKQREGILKKKGILKLPPKGTSVPPVPESSGEQQPAR